MSTATTTNEPRTLARGGGFLSDLATIARRAIRSIPRDPESVIPALIIPVFFFTVNVGALQKFTEGALPMFAGDKFQDFSFKAFQLPVSIVFAVTGVSRAAMLVIDIQSGYFDRLLLSPVRRLAILIGLIMADFVLIVALTLPVIGVGMLLGVRFTTGPLGFLLFVLLAALWGMAFNAFPYAIALKTGNPAAVNTSFVLFFPFAFLTTAFVPREALTGWLETIAGFNPVTYLLDALRSLLYVGWDGEILVKALLAIGCVAVVSYTLAMMALRSRTRRA